MSENRIPTASQIETQQVILQADNYQDCALIAIVNLYLKMGLEPPIFEQMGAVITKMRGELSSTSPPGMLTMTEIFLVITRLGYPAVTDYAATKTNAFNAEFLRARQDFNIPKPYEYNVLTGRFAQPKPTGQN